MLNVVSKIAPPYIQAIEDAVLFGHIREIVSVLDMVANDSQFPEELRSGLEALLYFRIHYGKDGDLRPTSHADKEKVLQMESMWGKELIEMIGHYPDLTEARYG